MVTYIPQGRAGNALFQCAMVLQYSLKHGLDYHIPAKTNDPKWNPIYFPHLQNPKYNPHKQNVIIQEQEHGYQDIPFDERWRDRNIIFKGYWQTFAYSEWCRDYIIEKLGFEWRFNTNWVSIHVRRGDYLMYQNKHPKITMDYYNEAIQMFPDANFQVFSDDIQWCKQNFIGKQFHFSEGQNEINDLTDMSCCNNNICSPSTYALWGYWLNQNLDKIGVFPDKWFVDGHGGLDTSQIVPKECIRIKI